MTESRMPRRRAKETEDMGVDLPGDIQPPASLQRPVRPKTRAKEAYVTPPSGGDDPVAKRIEEIRQRRRERGSADVSGLRQKLSIPEESKDPRFVYRWVDDKSTRHYEMKRKDWEYVEDETIARDERNSGTGTRIERIANERTVQKPEKTFLMRKPREFYEEDKAREQELIRQNEEGIRRGLVKNEKGEVEQGMYIPSSGMKIDHDR